LCWDVEVAYLNSIMPLEHQCPVILPKGMKTFCKETNEELHRCMVGGLYGHPISDKLWTECRDGWLLKEFNSNGWKCTQSVNESCLFILRSPSGGRCLMLIHTDDGETIGDNMEDLQYIMEKANDRFGVRVQPTTDMLGMHRERHNGVVELTQAAYIDKVRMKFEKYMPKGTRKCRREIPLPSNTVISRIKHEENKTEQKLVEDQGMYEVAGCLNWAARLTMPDCAFAVSQLCKVLNCATRDDFSAGIKVIDYMV